MRTLKISILTIITTALLSSCGYNSMVEKDEAITAQWANVETQYQRRADLIPNLVQTVKGYASHEKDVFESVTKARAEATSVKIDPSNLTPQAIENFQKMQSGVTSALSRLLAVSERYPELKANQNFLELQAQLEGTENRIAVERRRFNETVQDYNTYIRQFPRVIYAGWFGFEKKSPFAAEAGSEKAPKVKF